MPTILISRKTYLFLVGMSAALQIERKEKISFDKAINAMIETLQILKATQEQNKKQKSG